MCDNVREEGCCGQCDILTERPKPPVECEVCHRETHPECIHDNWKDTGWSVCDDCNETVPTFALKLIDELNTDADKYLAALRQAYQFLVDPHNVDIGRISSARAYLALHIGRQWLKDWEARNHVET